MHYLGLYHYLALLSLLSYNILTAVVSFFMVSWGQIFTTSHLPLYYAFFYIVNQGKFIATTRYGLLMTKIEQP